MKGLRKNNATNYYYLCRLIVVFDIDGTTHRDQLIRHTKNILAFTMKISLFDGSSRETWVFKTIAIMSM